MSEEEITQMAPGLIQAFAAQEENEEQGGRRRRRLRMKQFLLLEHGLLRLDWAVKSWLEES